MTYPITDEIKQYTSPHTFQISTGIDLTDADAVAVYWLDSVGTSHYVVASKTATPTDGLIEWTDSFSFWSVRGYWNAEAHATFGTDLLIGDVFVVPITTRLGL